MWQIKMIESKQDSVKVSMIEIRGYPLLVDQRREGENTEWNLREA